MLLHNAVADGKSETSALPRDFCRKKGIVDFLDVLTTDANPGIRDDNLNSSFHNRRTNTQHPAFRHCVGGIEEEVQEHLLQFPSVSSHHRCFREQVRSNLYLRGLEGMFQQRKRFVDDLMNIHSRELSRIHPRETQETVHDFCCSKRLRG